MGEGGRAIVSSISERELIRKMDERWTVSGRVDKVRKRDGALRNTDRVTCWDMVDAGGGWSG